MAGALNMSRLELPASWKGQKEKEYLGKISMVMASLCLACESGVCRCVCMSGLVTG